MKMSFAMPGAVFEHCGQVPASEYSVDSFQSPLEEAVYLNDLDLLNKLIKEGHKVTVRMKIGKMSCLEYAAMMGHVDILRALIENSDNSTMLKKYFGMDDVVDRAYLISKNKDVFFTRDGLAEANRYEAALYTAVEYNQPKCVDLMLLYLGPREPAPQSFYIHRSSREGDAPKLDKLSAMELAQVRGHNECIEILNRRRTLSQ